jgi:hypothetical protein
LGRPCFLVGLFDGGRRGKRIDGQCHPRRHQHRFGFRSRRPVRGRAPARGLPTKPAIKQVDRRLSNQGIDIDAAPRHFVPYGVRIGMPLKIMSIGSRDWAYWSRSTKLGIRQ